MHGQPTCPTSKLYISHINYITIKFKAYYRLSLPTLTIQGQYPQKLEYQVKLLRNKRLYVYTASTLE